MNVSVFGKQGCDLCKTTYRKLEHCLSKWGMNEKVELRFVEVESVDGMAEAAFYDVLKVPTTLVIKDEEALARWEAMVPPSEEVQAALDPKVH